MAEQAIYPLSHQSGNKPIALIADDSRVVRISLRNILKDHCQLIEVEDGEQAWEELNKNPGVDIVFSDLSMPHLDGRGLLNKLRQSDSKHLARLPFIVVTGNEATPEITEEISRLGATGIVNKPFNSALITGYLEQLPEQTSEESISEWQDTEPQSDFLDHVPDRSKFREIASRELSFAIRNKNELSLALVRIDQFEEILEHYSDGAIEHILLALHDIIQQYIHPDDTVAYFGNGCFALLRPASNAIGTRYLGRKILEDLTAKHFYLGESDQIVSASIGISAPDIKPGIRLVDLMNLAEGRLKAAMDNGGAKVVDKGNENLTPVTSGADLSEFTKTHATDTLQSNAVIVKQAADTQHSAYQEEKQPAQYLEMINELTSENRQLISDIEHLKGLSGESDKLRRQLFEIESQQQQIKLKYHELQDHHEHLIQRCEALEQENRHLSEEDNNTSTWEEAHHIAEDENRQLEAQNKELLSRAEKAELESLKSNQLVSSLRENSHLLHMQLDQVQQQLAELQGLQSSQPALQKQPPQPDNAAVFQHRPDSTLLKETHTATLTLKAMPDATSMEHPSVSEHIFPDKDQLSSKKKPKKTKKRLSMPPFRIDPEPLFFKNGLNFSAFTIAGMILCIMLLVGGIFFYRYLQETPVAETTNTQRSLSDETPLDRSETSINSLDKTQAPNQLPLNTSGIPFPDSRQDAISKTLRAEKELILRQIAEEEFQRRLNGSVKMSTPRKQALQNQRLQSTP
jgi:diguanylate cyclase (GGDEF)-like protein